MKSPIAAGFPSLLVLSFSVITGTAQTVSQWLANPVDGQFNNPANWVGGMMPVNPVSLFFDASTIYAVNNPYVGDLEVNDLYFQAGAGAYVISGGTLQFISLESGLFRPELTVQTNSNITINSAIKLNGSPFFIGGLGTGDLTLNGGITDMGSTLVSLSKSGKLTLNGSYSFNGGLNASQGDVFVTNGSSLTTGTSSALKVALIGTQNGGTATVNIGGGTGTSLWKSHGGVAAGTYGTGVVNLTGGGRIESSGLSLGEETTGNGVVNIGGGAGSAVWINTGNTLIGNRNDGTITITGGGSLTNQAGIIGNNADTDGTVNVGGGTGPSTWTNNTHLVIGQDGTGELNITGNGTVTNTTGYIAYGSTSTGTVNVGGGTGASTWTNSGNLYVATSGTGTMTITGGGTVNNTNGYIAEQGNSSADVFVGGGTGESKWINTGHLYVGAVGDGTLTITGGGSVSNVIGFIGDSAGGSGTVTVGGGTGTSTWTNTGHLVVGQSGDGEMTITGGGTVTNTSGYIAYGNNTIGTVTVGGGTGESSWINSGALSVGTSGVATLLIKTGGLVETTALEDGNAVSSVKLDGGTLRITGSDNFGNKLVLETNGGTIEVKNSGTTVSPLGGITGGGPLIKTGLGTLSLSNSGNTYSGGTIVRSGQLRVEASNSLGSGDVRVEGGTLATSGSVTISNRIYLAGGSFQRTFDPSQNIAGTFNVTSGFAGGTATDASILAGTAGATPGDLHGQFTAGNGEVASDIYQLSGSLLSGATVPLVLQLSISGENTGAFLGWLNTGNGEWENAFAANAGNNATFTANGYFAGDFNDFQTTHGSDLTDYIGAWGTYTEDGETHTWAVVNNGGSYAVIPEPSAMLLVLAGAAVVVGRRRRD